MYIIIRFVNNKPYKYLMQTIWNKRLKRGVPKIIRYEGKATIRDVAKYYKGKKYKNYAK